MNQIQNDMYIRYFQKQHELLMYAIQVKLSLTISESS